MKRRRSVEGRALSERKRRCWSSILFALPWPVPVYGLVGALLIVTNEQILHRHVFAASRCAAVAALVALLVAAAWSDRHAAGRECCYEDRGRPSVRQ